MNGVGTRMSYDTFICDYWHIIAGFHVGQASNASSDASRYISITMAIAASDPCSTTGNYGIYKAHPSSRFNKHHA
jgi:hypothetical protein